MAVNLNNPGNLNQSQQIKSKPKTSGFTNIQRLLGANTQNRLGQAIGSGVKNIAGRTQAQTQQAQQQFGQQLDPTKQNLQKGTEVQKTLSNLDFTKDPSETASALQPLGNEQYAQATKNVIGGYQGPRTLQDEQRLQSQAQDLQQTGKGLLTSGGRQAALQRFVNVGPAYTQGKQRLDNLLLGQDPNALRSARREASQQSMETSKALSGARAEAEGISSQYGQLGSDLSKGLTGAQEQYTKSLQNRLETARTAGKTDVEGLQQATKNQVLSTDQYNRLLNDVLQGNQDIANLTPDDLSKLFSYDPSKYNISNVAQSGDLTTRNVLSQLAGRKPEDLQQLDESQIGQTVNTLQPSNEGLNALTQRREAGQQAVKDFKWMNPLNYLEDTGTTYEQADQVAPLIEKALRMGASWHPTSGSFSYHPDPKVRAAQDEVRQALGKMGKADRHIDNLYNTYKNTKEQHGIGRKLSDLLYKGK